VGQLGTLESSFDAMPADSGMAFVVIQQSSVDATRVTCEMLSRHTEIPIHGVVDDTAIERNSVYLIPPHIASCPTVYISVLLPLVAPPAALGMASYN
jgi:chemotaxis response regulator CheB